MKIEEKIEVYMESLSYIQNPFHPNHLSNPFINYLNEECEGIPFHNKIKLVIHAKTLSEQDKERLCDMIHAHYGISVKEDLIIQRHEHIKELILFIIGAICILISYTIGSFTELILPEVFTIAGWVAMWEAFYNILFTETKRKLNIKRKRQLAHCHIQFIVKDKMN